MISSPLARSITAIVFLLRQSRGCCDAQVVCLVFFEAYVLKVEYYLATKEKTFYHLQQNRSISEEITLSEISHVQKDKFYVFLLIMSFFFF